MIIYRWKQIRFPSHQIRREWARVADEDDDDQSRSERSGIDIGQNVDVRNNKHADHNAGASSGGQNGNTAGTVKITDNQR